jgi:hypothetical protein
MNRTLSRLAAAVVAAAGPALTAAASQAAPIAQVFDGDAVPGDLAAMSWSVLEDALVAEGRIGDTVDGGTSRTHEINTGRNTGGTMDEADFVWPNAAYIDFTFTWDGNTTSTFTADGTTVAYTDIDPASLAAMNGLIIRARTGLAGTGSSRSIAFDELTLNGETLPDFSYDGTGAAGASLLLVRGIDLSAGLTLSGRAMMAWTDAPTNSSLAFQFKAAEYDGLDPGHPGTTVPEPGTLALLGAGLFGLATLRRARRYGAPRQDPDSCSISRRA